MAFDEDEDHPWQAGRAVSVRPQGDGFVSVMRQAIADGDWGSASIVIGPGDNPREGNQATASGAAFIQKSEKFKVWYECNSICLPINAGSTCLARFNDVGGTPAGRLAFHATKLRFGDWVPAFGGSPAVAKEMPDTALSATAASDGFLFVTIRAAMFAQMGGVEGLIGEQAVASSFVHWAESSQPYPQQSFCIPVPARSRYSIQRVFPMSAPTIQAFWIPIVSTEWVMKEAEPHRDTNTVISAGTNGILHGRIYAAHDRQRGTLKIYVGRDADVATPTAQSYVAASVQLDQQSNRFVPRNSLMLPVAIGTRYQAVTQSPLEDLPVDLFWTPLVPA